MYPIGQIKLTWINPNNYEILESQFFNSIPEAIQYAQGRKDWLIFELKETNGNYYNWQLLPYGEHRKYINGMKARDNRGLIIGGLVILFSIAIYSTYLISKA